MNKSSLPQMVDFDQIVRCSTRKPGTITNAHREQLYRSRPGQSHTWRLNRFRVLDSCGTRNVHTLSVSIDGKELHFDLDTLGWLNRCFELQELTPGDM